MFKSMDHKYIIHQKYFIGAQHYGFCVKLFIKRNETLPKTRMVLTTNHFLNTVYQTETLLNTNNGKNFYIKQLEMNRYISFPKYSPYATFEYILPSICLLKTNTFIFSGDTDFTQMDVLFLPDDMINDEYKFSIRK